MRYPYSLKAEPVVSCQGFNHHSAYHESGDAVSHNDYIVAWKCAILVEALCEADIGRVPSFLTSLPFLHFPSPRTDASNYLYSWKHWEHNVILLAYRVAHMAKLEL